MAAPPANKRQRLSPGPSPLGTPYEQPQYPFPPAQPYGAPNDYHPQTAQQSFHHPQPHHNQLPPIDTSSRPTGAGTMGPPEKPRADKATDINDLSDLVTAAGVDLRAEENYMAATYRNKHQDTLSQSFGASFGSTASATASPGDSFQYQQWGQQSFGNYPPYQPNGTFRAPAIPPLSVEEELKRKHQRAAREWAEHRAHALKNPFLQADAVRNKLANSGYTNGVSINTAGLHQERPERPQVPPLKKEDVRGAYQVGPDGEGLLAAKITSKLDPDSKLTDVLALLSLATNERLRDLLEDAYAISRSRQHGTHGVVPPEWTGMAQGNGEPKDVQARSLSIMHTAWDQIPDSAVSPLTIFPPKNSNSDPNTRIPTPPPEPEAPLQTTVAYSSPIPSALQTLAKADRDAEKKRLERRKKRDKERQSSVAGEDPMDTPDGTNTPSTPLPEIPRISKKEALKQSKANLSEDYMARQANQAANMALGGGKSKYAWMNAAPAAAPAALGAGVGLGRGVGNVNAASRAGSANIVPQVPQVDVGMRSKDTWKRLGEYKEGGGVQIRDFVAVLEREGHEKRTLQKCLARMSSKDDVK